MLSYRHAFHAGNHADVLKHFVLVQIADYMMQKEVPIYYIDTHAGAGGYSLDAGYATKLAEYEDGIGRLWERADLPEAMDRYMQAVRAFNGSKKLIRYPGSPWLAQHLLRESDKLRLFELHPTDVELLGNTFRSAGKRAIVTLGDGFDGLNANLPPPSRRALVLIDPAYELRGDYSLALKGLQAALTRFPTGSYVLWYPALSKPESRDFPERLKKLVIKSWLHVGLNVRQRRGDGVGMHGSGLFIINPPWTLHDTLQKTLPWLSQALAQDDSAGFVLEKSAE